MKKIKKKKIAVIENEFAAPIGTENELKGNTIEKSAFVVEILETASGCLCCAGRGNFLDLLIKLIPRKSEYDYVIVETTGMADPTFAKNFFEVPIIRQNFYVDGIVTLVDAKHATQHLDEIKEDKLQINEAIEQIAVADRIIINKTDLVTSDEIIALENRIKSINSISEIMKSQYSKVDLSNILSINAFDLEKILKHDPGFMEFRPYRQHDPNIQGINLTTMESVDAEKFTSWLKKYIKFT